MDNSVEEIGQQTKRVGEVYFLSIYLKHEEKFRNIPFFPRAE
jgi:hypothetical protein